MIKTILAPLSGSDTDQIVLETALSLARPLDAHIECSHTFLDVGEAARHLPEISFLLGAALHSALESLEERCGRETAAALRHFAEFRDAQAFPANAGPPGSGLSMSMQQDFGDPVASLCRHARHNDLVVMGRPKDGDGVAGNLHQRLLLEGGSPILLVPEYTSGSLLDTVAICWKETAEASRAVALALPLLKRAKNVFLISVSEEDNGPHSSMQPIVRRLAWHGIAAEVTLTARGAHSTMNTIRTTARDRHADLLVMGGFSRGPMREMLFGGCTQEALSFGDLPIFIAR